VKHVKTNCSREDKILIMRSATPHIVGEIWSITKHL